MRLGIVMSDELKVLDEPANSPVDPSASNSGSPAPTPPVEDTPAEDSVSAEVSDAKVAPVNSGYVTSDTTTIHDVDGIDRETLAYEGDPKDEEVAYTLVTHLDPQRQKDPHGVYLDDIQRRDAEVVRARQEGREPDLENPAVTCSDTLIPTVQAAGLAPSGAAVPVSTYESVNVGSPQDSESTEDANVEDENE
jgi:hypothetical protein